MAFWNDWLKSDKEGDDVAETTHDGHGKGPTLGQEVKQSAETAPEDAVEAAAEKETLSPVADESRIQDPNDKEKSPSQTRGEDAGLDEVISDMEANAVEQQKGEDIHTPGASADEHDETKSLLVEEEPTEEKTAAVGGDAEAKVNPLDLMSVEDLGTKNAIIEEVDRQVSFANTSFDEAGGASEKVAEQTAEKVVERTLESLDRSPENSQVAAIIENDSFGFVDNTVSQEIPNKFADLLAAENPIETSSFVDVVAGEATEVGAAADAKADGYEKPAGPDMNAVLRQHQDH
jgi:hypothetical protein